MAKTVLFLAVLRSVGAVDVVSVYVHESGGILKASQNLAMAHAAGMSGLIGAMPELGIGTAAHIHIALAAAELPHDSDCCGSMYWLEVCKSGALAQFLQSARRVTLQRKTGMGGRVCVCVWCCV